MGQPSKSIESFSVQLRKFPAGWYLTVKCCEVDAEDGSKSWSQVFETIVTEFEHTLNKRQLAKRLLAVITQELK